MSQGDRSFTVVDITKARKKVNIGSSGRYVSKSPVSAAKKAFGRICREKRYRGKCAMVVTVQETTQGSGGKTYSYKVSRDKLKEPLVISRGGGMFGSGETITIKFVVKAKAV